MESDHCPCGGRWMADGNGGRFCPDCHRSHRENREPYPDQLPTKLTSSRAGSAVRRHEEEDDPILGSNHDKVSSKPSGLKPTKSLDLLFQNATRQLGHFCATLDDLGNAKPGPWYQQAMNLAKKIGKWLRAWQEED